MALAYRSFTARKLRRPPTTKSKTTKTKMKTLTTFAFCALTFAASLNSLTAASITLGGPLPTFRTATLSDALAGAGNSGTGSGNATAAVVSTLFGTTYTERGSVAGSGGPGNYVGAQLTVDVLTGSWGTAGPLTGNWTINNPTFWTTYANAAISLHVGNGQGEPDHFIWKITPGAQMGTWSYNGNSADLGGGGLSNLKLYSNGTDGPGNGGGGRVPDGGTTIACLGFALLGLGSMRKLIGSKA